MSIKYIILVVFFLLTTSTVEAEYVLPYPSYMPGNKLYRFSLMLDKIRNYWYFGNIAQDKYHLALSDKYLVEAKTLFEYKQYLLAADALHRSDQEFKKLTGSIAVQPAADKHSEVLTDISFLVPETFTWTPEKGSPTDLDLSSMIQSSIELRSRVASDAAWQY